MSDYFDKKYDSGKPMMNLLPFDALIGAAEVLTYGKSKYGANSWRDVPDAMDRYEAALLRHLAAYKTGEAIDPETGLAHLDHLLCNALFLSSLDREKRDKISEDAS